MLLNVISIYLFISIIVATFFAAFIQSRGKATYVKIIMLVCLAIDIYMFGYAAELYAVSLAQKQFWNKFQYIGIPFVSALWLTVGLVYTKKLRPRPILKLSLAYTCFDTGFPLYERPTSPIFHIDEYTGAWTERFTPQRKRDMVLCAKRPFYWDDFHCLCAIHFDICKEEG